MNVTKNNRNDTRVKEYEVRRYHGEKIAFNPNIIEITKRRRIPNDRTATFPRKSTEFIF